jgi:hypothetical protein
MAAYGTRSGPIQFGGYAPGYFDPLSMGRPGMQGFGTPGINSMFNRPPSGFSPQYGMSQPGSAAAGMMAQSSVGSGIGRALGGVGDALGGAFDYLSDKDHTGRAYLAAQGLGAAASIYGAHKAAQERERDREYQKQLDEEERRREAAMDPIRASMAANLLSSYGR